MTRRKVQNNAVAPTGSTEKTRQSNARMDAGSIRACVAYISVRGGRGSGKTKNFARALIMLSTVQKLRVLCTREVQLSIRESVYATLVNEIEELGLSSQFEILSNEIRSKKGGSFYFAVWLKKPSIRSSLSPISIFVGWKKPNR
jgi:phage terminase large subunit